MFALKITARGSYRGVSAISQGVVYVGNVVDSNEAWIDSVSFPFWFESVTDGATKIEIRRNNEVIWIFNDEGSSNEEFAPKLIKSLEAVDPSCEDLVGLFYYALTSHMLNEGSLTREFAEIKDADYEPSDSTESDNDMQYVASEITRILHFPISGIDGWKAIALYLNLPES